MLIDLLSNYPIIFTCLEIKAIMYEKLSEDKENMSTTLIDCCLDALEQHEINQSKNPFVKFFAKLQYRK